MSSSKPSFRLRDTVSLSGWIYADLLLGLMVLFLVSTRGATPEQLVPPSTATPTPTTTLTATASLSASLTPTPTNTATPTRTPTPTATRTPTSTATRTPTLTITPQAFVVGLNPTPYRVTLRVSPSLIPGIMAGKADARATAQAQLRRQMHYCFANMRGQAGMVLTFGSNPDPNIGNRLAALANALLREEYEDLFARQRAEAVMRDYHTITTNPAQNGVIELEVFFITLPEFPDIIGTYGATCVPPQSD